MRISDWSSDVCSSDLLFIRAIGGRYDVLRPGTPSGLNPLRLEDNPANRQFLIDWLALLAGRADVEELAQIKDEVDANYAKPLHHRRLPHIVELLPGGNRPGSEERRGGIGGGRTGGSGWAQGT